MRNNKMKGFTLVELLVVIAILAILATVSVVGYTSYIESTQVRVDSDLANQLNHLLEAYKVDFREDITEDNIHEVTANLLKEGGLTELNPKSAEYGYHYYYNLEIGKYELLHNDYAVNDESVLDKLIRFALTAFADEAVEPAPAFKVTAGNCFTKEYKYFLVDTAGDLADVITGYYSFEKLEGNTLEDRFAKYLEKVENSEIDTISRLVNETVFVTEKGNFVADVNGTHNKLVFHEGATFLGNILKDTDSATDDVILGGENYLLTLTDNTTIELPAGIKLPANSLNISVAEGKKVTIILDASSWTNELKDVVDAYFTNDKVTVKLGEVEYKINGNYIHNADTYGTEGDTYVDTLKFNNPLDSLEFSIVDDGDSINTTTVKNGDKNEIIGVVAWDKGTFKLQITKTAGTKNDGRDISNLELNWTTSHPDYVSVDDSTGEIIVTLDDEYDSSIEYITITATAKVSKQGYMNDTSADATFATYSYRIYVGGIKSNVVSIANKADWVFTDNTYHVTVFLDNKTNGTTYDLLNSFGYNNLTDANGTALVKVDNSITVTSDDTSIATYDTTAGQIKVLKEGTATLTVKSNKYSDYEYKVQITVADFASKLPVQIKDNATYTYIGSGAPIVLSDIFTGSLPDNTRLVIFNGEVNEEKTYDAYMNPATNRGFLGKSPLADGDVYINDSAYIINEQNKKDLNSNGKPITALADTITLASARESGEKIVFALFSNGVRVSPDFTVYVVNAVNVHNYSELTTQLTANKSVVLLNNITDMPAGTDLKTGGHFEIKAGTTLYGNMFDIDVKNGVKQELGGIITLRGTLRDVRVLGAIYPDFAISVDAPYGSAIVDSYAGTIINCYISHGRSPVRVEGGTTTIRDSVLFGGSYCNIDMVGGTLHIQGKVTTVQQTVTADDGTKVIGIGISGWFNDASTKTVVFDDITVEDEIVEADLIQYNFLDSDTQNNLPSLYAKDVAFKYPSLEGVLSAYPNPILELKTPFSKIINNDGNQYTPHILTNNGKSYVNSGIACLDKYDISITPLADYSKGSEIKITILPHADEDNVTITIGYDKPKPVIGGGYTEKATSGTYTQWDNSLSDGKIVITTDLKKDVPVVAYLVNNSIFRKALGADFSVSIANNKGVSLQSLKLSNATDGVINDTAVDNYGHTTYVYGLPGEFSAVSLVVDAFHSSGIHFNQMIVDVYTFNKDNAEHNARLTEYLAMGNYYNAGENGVGAQFVNGKLVTYTDYTNTQQ